MHGWVHGWVDACMGDASVDKAMAPHAAEKAVAYTNVQLSLILLLFAVCRLLICQTRCSTLSLAYCVALLPMQICVCVILLR